MTQPGGPDPAASTRPPVTGEEAVDQALADLDDLHSAPLSDHHDRLAQAHEALHQVLHRDGDSS